MYYYEKNDKINALRRSKDDLGRKYVDFYSADKEKFVKRYRRRFIAGVIIAVICISAPFFLLNSFFGALAAGVFIYFAISFITYLDDCSITSLFSKDSAMLKFKIDTDLYGRWTDRCNYIAVRSEILAEYGTSEFWNKFMNVKNEELLQEATEIAIQERILKDAIAGMKKYIREVSESAIRDEVFHKLDEANDKHAALIDRFDAFQLHVLRASDAVRDEEVLQHMASLDQLDSQAA